MTRRLAVVRPPAPGAIAQSVREFVDDKRADAASPKTIRTYSDVLEGVLLPHLAAAGVTDMAGITSAELNSLTAGLLDGSASRSGRALSKASAASYGRTINAWLSWVAQQAGETQTARAKLPRERKRVLDTLSRPEMAAIEDAADSERDKLIVRLLSDTGMRVGELLGLTAADVRVAEGRNVVKVRGKGDRERLVPVRPALAKRLLRHATKTRPRDATSSRLFLGNRRSPRTGGYEPLTPSGVDQLIRDLAVRAGLTKRVYPHLFRHSFITNYLRSGGSPILAAQIVGHESLGMITSTYQHLVISDAASELMRVLGQDGGEG